MVEPFVMLVPPAVPARNAAEFIAHVQANPGKLKSEANIQAD